VALTLWFLSMSLIVVIIAAGNVSGSAELPAVASGWAGIAAPVVMVGAAAVLVRSSLAQSQRLEEDVRRFLIRLTSNGTG
jgi:succinate-acetate transporter protein